MQFLSPQQRGIFYAVASGLCYGLMGYFGMSIVDAGFSVYNMMFWRFASSGFFVALILLKYNQKKASSLALFRVAFIGGLIYCAGAIAYFISCKAIGTGLAMVIFFIYPAIVVLINRIFYKTHIYRTYYLAISMILLGIVLLADIKEVGLNWSGIGFAVISAISYAVYIVLSKGNELPPLTSTFMISIGCSFVALIVALADDSFFVPRSLAVWVNIFGIGIICTALPILLFLESMKYISSEKASIFSVSEPVFTVIFGVILLDEVISLNQAIGVVVLLAGALATLLQKKASEVGSNNS